MPALRQHNLADGRYWPLSRNQGPIWSSAAAPELVSASRRTLSDALRASNRRVGARQVPGFEASSLPSVLLMRRALRLGIISRHLFDRLPNKLDELRIAILRR